MEGAQAIRQAVERVNALRTQLSRTPELQAATAAVKAFQGRRFGGTYQDLLQSTEYGAAARFFLEELYSDKDYSQRDAQFARVAKALQTFFPKQVVATAVALAELHVLTEELDHEMALAWMTAPPATDAPNDAVARYIRAWKTVGRAPDRYLQLDQVLHVGGELNRLTQTRGLRTMLKMMRRPAVAAGLGSLQSFLECGFDTFAGMSGQGARAVEFLATIRARESQWMQRLFEAPPEECAAALHHCMGSVAPAPTPP